MHKIQCFKNFKIYIGHENFLGEYTHFYKYKYIDKNIKYTSQKSVISFIETKKV